MSRTRKTRPPFLRALDVTDTRVTFSESHDHRAGGCDLPSLADARSLYLADNRAYNRLTCNYDWHSHASACGCPMCTMQVERRSERRRSRHGAKREANIARNAHARGELVDA